MRTTIELDDEHRAELLRLAARRGLKGFSEIVREAIDAYLRAEGNKTQAIQAALALEGCLSKEEAEDLQRSAREIREQWQCS